MQFPRQIYAALFYTTLFHIWDNASSFNYCVQPLNLHRPCAAFVRSPSNPIFSRNKEFVFTPGRDSAVKIWAKDGDEDDKEGMKQAFDALNELSELDLSDESPLSKALEERRNKKESEKSTNTESPEEELKLYSEMYAELEDKGEDEMYGDILSELEGEKSESKTVEVEMDEVIESFEDIDEIGDVFSEESQNDFMDRAIAEALKEAKESAPGKLSDSILDDAEIMKEIEKVFDDANKKLLESVEEMRKEQTQMSKATADERSEAVRDDEARLAEAEGSISRLVDKVNRETAAVESAIKDLERAQSEMSSSPLAKIANLRDAGVVKQSSFVLAALFTVRSLTDLVLIIGPNSESHATAAAVQAGLAVVCALIFIL